MAKPNKRKRKSSAAALPPYHLFNETKNDVDKDADGFLEGVANLLEGKKNIVVLVGAGISTSAGIPDFRSKDKGLYNTLDAEALGLSCPEDLFCIEFFKSNPVPFYRFAKHLYYPNLDKRDSKNTTTRRASRRGKKKDSATTTNTAAAGTAVPSDSHKLLALLEQRKMLLRVYTQNIDGLESSAGVSDSRIVYCHGSLRSMSCTRCSKKNLPLNDSILESIQAGSVPLCRVPLKRKAKSSEMKNGEVMKPALLPPTRVSQRKRRRPSYREDDYIMEEEEEDTSLNGRNTYGDALYGQEKQQQPYCCGGILKPAITFFGETLDNSVGRQIESDHSKADALIVIGTSLSVAPISRVIEYLPKTIPRILINRTIVHPKAASSNGNNTNRETEGDSGSDDDDDGEFRKNYVFDAYLLGFCDDITRVLGKQLGLGWLNGAAKKRKTRNKTPKRTKNKLLQLLIQTIEQHSNNDDEDSLWAEVTVPSERVLLFPGALPTPVTTKKSTKKESEEEETVCFQVHCDECSMLISTSKPIFNCSQCFDYDLCEACYPKKSKLHYGGRHTFCVK